LFQNRYKSIICDEDAYFKELVRYIHLNPLRVKSVGGETGQKLIQAVALPLERSWRNNGQGEI
jgi:hypothetical protein